MKIPEIRTEMHELAEEHGIPRLHELADELLRRRVAKPAKTDNVPMTDKIRKRIRLLSLWHPGWSQDKIGREAGPVDGGRVSETLSGFRT